MIWAHIRLVKEGKILCHILTDIWDAHFHIQAVNNYCIERPGNAACQSEAISLFSAFFNVRGIGSSNSLFFRLFTGKLGTVIAGGHVTSSTVGTLRLTGNTVLTTVFLAALVALYITAAGRSNVMKPWQR